MTANAKKKRRFRGMLTRLTLTGLATLCALVGALAVASVSAFAEKIYFPGPSFGELGSGPGQFKEPVGVAVNESSNSLLEPTAGDVYVVDKGNNRVERFGATGEYKGQFDGSGKFEAEGKTEVATPAPTGKFSAPEQVAVDNSGKLVTEDPSVGDVYITDTGHKVIDKFSATGEYLGQLTKAEECENEHEPLPCMKSRPIAVPFNELRNVAIDPAGDLWVFETVRPEPNTTGYIDEFSASGSFIARFETVGFEHDNHGFAVDSSSFYVGAGIDKEISKQLTTTGKLVEEFSNNVNAVAVVSAGSDQLADDLLVDKGSSIVLYGPSGIPYNRPLEVFPSEEFPISYEGLSESYGIAANAVATIYASERVADRVESFDYVPVPTVTTEAASEVSETGLTLHGNVNPEGEEVKTCYFEYGSKSDEYTAEAPCKQKASEIIGTHNFAVSAELSGLEPTDVRSFRLVAIGATGVARRGQSLAVARPVTTSEAISGVESSVATVSAQIDPGGLATCYRIEYGTSTLYGKNTLRECIQAGGEGVGVRVKLSGLQPGTQYHFRVLATNALGPTAGEDFTFATFPQTVSELPDGRIDELVSPVGAGHNTEVYVPEGLEGTIDPLGAHGIVSARPFQATASGEAVAYLGDPSATGGNGDIGDTLGNQYVARRSPLGGWKQVDIDPSGYANEYVALSGDLSVGVLATSELVREYEYLPPEAPAGYYNLYRRSIGGSPPGLPGTFEPLVATMPEDRGPGEFSTVLNGKLSPKGLGFGGGNAGTEVVRAFSHLLFEANAALPSTPTAPEGSKSENNLYDSVGGRLYLVNVLPGGTAEANATFGRQGPSENGIESPETSNAISADGSRIYWSAVEAVEHVLGPSEGGNGKKTGIEERPKALYVRENDTQPESPIEDGECTVPTDACTVQVDRAEPRLGPSGGGQFWAASSNGAEVFFTDENRLTRGSTAAPGMPDLYEYDLEAPEEERLSDLSIPAKGREGVHADVQGVVGTSEDGSYVYFVADGALTEGENAEDKKPVENQPNLYLSHEGVTTFIATLSSEDGDFTGGGGGNDGDWQADPGHRTAEVTPGGHSVVFMSRQGFTGYDNLLENDEHKKVSLTEVFVYDSDTGRIMCASCNPSGEAPVSSPTFPTSSQDIARIWGSFLPISESLADYQPRVISDDGSRVFFDSIEPLVPQDTNGLLDVYEWEREGAGSCREAPGCIYLLSSGLSTDNSYLVDTSASGNDAFFVTRARLVKGDRSDYDELYDARVDGNVSPEEAVCSGTGCQGVPPAAPVFATPASVTFNGVGNFLPPVRPTIQCPKGKKLSHSKCVKAKARSKHGAKAKKSNRTNTHSGRSKQ
jgi:hypothetical protein